MSYSCKKRLPKKRKSAQPVPPAPPPSPASPIQSNAPVPVPQPAAPIEPLKRGRPRRTQAQKDEEKRIKAEKKALLGRSEKQKEVTAKMQERLKEKRMMMEKEKLRSERK